MNLLKVITRSLLGVALLSGAALADYVFVLPPEGGTTLQGFSDQLLTMGTVEVPAGTFKAVASAQGDKLIVLARNSSAGVSFVTITDNQFSGAARPLSLDGLPAAAAQLTRDGQKLVVLAGEGPSVLFVINLLTENIATGGRIPIQGTVPRDVVVSPDSQYAFVLTAPGVLTVVNLETGQSEGVFAVGDFPASVNYAPNGKVYVTSRYAVYEHKSWPPFERTGYSQILGQAAKLHFTPDGRYAFAANELLNGSSLILFDTQTPGFNNTSEPASMAPIQYAAIPSQAGGLELPGQIIMTGSGFAYVYISTTGRLYRATYPAIGPITEVSLGSLGVVQGMIGLTASNEFPTPRSLFINIAGQTTRFDIPAGQPLTTAVSTSGPLAYGARAATGTPESIYVYGGGQTVGPNVLPAPYAVKVTGVNGKPLANVPVTFQAISAGVSLSVTAALTNLDGVAVVQATAPAVNGEFTVRASAGALTADIVSTVTGGTGGGGGGGGTEPRIVEVSGQGQLIELNFGFVDPMVIRVEDGEGNPIPGKQVTWTEQGGATLRSPLIGVTDASGEAFMEWLALGAVPFGQNFLTYTITASTDVGSVSFKAVGFPNRLSAPDVQLLTPAQDTRVINAKIGARMENAIRVAAVTSGAGQVGAPIPNVGLSVSTNFSNPTQGPVVSCEGGTPLTGSTGIASCTLIALGRPGQQASLNIHVGGDYRSFPGYSVNLLPGDPVAPVVVQGNNQSGRPGTVLPVTLVARIEDGSGNLLPGTAVTWQVVTAGTLTLQNTVSTANDAGQVSTRVLLGNTVGAHQIRLTAGDQFVLFNVTVEAAIGGLVKVSGDNQPAAVINTAFAEPLGVLVRDTGNQPLPNIPVTFTVTSGAAQLSNLTVNTAATGQAQVIVTAGVVAGPIVITASVTGQPPVTWNLQSRLPGPALVVNSFTNVATGATGVSPGALVLITGAGVAPGVDGWLNPSLLAGRLPLTHNGVTVEFQSGGNSYYAPIYQVANVSGVESVMIQVPFEIDGPTVNAIVYVGGGSTAVANIPVDPIMPGILEDFIDGANRAVVIRSDGLLVTPTTPARRGERVRMYAIGLGQTTPRAETNRVGVPAQIVRAAVTVGVNHEGVSTISVHMAQNLISIYEVVFEIPANAATGPDRPLGLVVAEFPDQPVYANGSVIAIGE